MLRVFKIVLVCLVIITLQACGPYFPAGTWTLVDTGKPATIVFTEMDFITPDLGWLSGWHSEGPPETDGGEVVLTKDGGKTWNSISKQIPLGIKYVYFYNDRQGWALNKGNDILGTTDSGETWTLVRKAGQTTVKYNYKNPGAPTEIPDPLIKIYFRTDKAGWAWGGGKKADGVEIAGIFLHSTDGGKTWQNVEYKFANELKTVFFIDDKTGWASDIKGGLYKSLDGGETWQKQPEDDLRPSINGIFFINTTKGWLVGDSYIGRTENGGQTWRRVKFKNTYLNDIFFVNENEGWAVGDNSKIMCTGDGGHNWQDQSIGIENQVNITHVRFFDRDTGWASGHNGLLLRYEGKK